MNLYFIFKISALVNCKNCSYQWKKYCELLYFILHHVLDVNSLSTPRDKEALILGFTSLCMCAIRGVS